MKYRLLAITLLITCYTLSQSNYRESLKAQELSKEGLKEKLSKENSTYKKAVLCNSIGLKYQKEGDFDGAMSYHRKALNYSKKLGKVQERAISLNKVGVVHYYKGDIDSAIYYFKASIPYYSDSKLKANSLNNLGLMYKLGQKPREAIDQYLKALTLFKKVKDDVNQTKVLNNIAALQKERKNYDKAKEYARRAEVIARKIGLEEQVMSSKTTLAGILVKQDSVPQAIALNKEIIAWAKRNNDISMRAIGMNNLASCYDELKMYEEELELYRQINDLYVSSKNESILSAVYVNMSTTFQSMKELDSALYYAKIAEKSAKGFGKTEFLETIYSQLSSVYKEKNVLDSSIYYKDAILLLRDSLNSDNEELLMHQLEEKYRNKELKGELHSSNKKVAQTMSTLNKVLIVLLAAAVLVVILVFLVRHSRGRSKRLKVQVGVKDERLHALKEEVTIKDQEIEELQFVKVKNKFPYPSNLTLLTEREKEVLEKVSEGLKDQEIADALFVSINTVRTHLRKIFVKIDARNRAEAIQFFNEYDLD